MGVFPGCADGWEHRDPLPCFTSRGKTQRGRWYSELWGRRQKSASISAEGRDRWPAASPLSAGSQKARGPNGITATSRADRPRRGPAPPPGAHDDLPACPYFRPSPEGTSPQLQRPRSPLGRRARLPRSREGPVQARSPDELKAGASTWESLIGKIRRYVEAGLIEGDPHDIAHVLSSAVQGLSAQESAGWQGTSQASRDRRRPPAFKALMTGLAPGGQPEISTCRSSVPIIRADHRPRGAAAAEAGRGRSAATAGAGKCAVVGAGPPSPGRGWRGDVHRRGHHRRNQRSKRDGPTGSSPSLYRPGRHRCDITPVVPSVDEVGVGRPKR